MMAVLLAAPRSPQTGPGPLCSAIAALLSTALGVQGSILVVILSKLFGEINRYSGDFAPIFDDFVKIALVFVQNKRKGRQTPPFSGGWGSVDGLHRGALFDEGVWHLHHPRL